MAFYPFFPLTQISGPLTVTGLLTTQAGIANSGGTIAGSGAGTGITTNGGTISTTGLNNISSSVGLIAQTGNLDIQAAGKGLEVAEGSNAKQGTFTLAGAATTVVANTSVTANSRILLTTQALGTVTAASTLAVSARTPGTSFTVTPSQATDTSVIAFEIFEPG